MNSALGVQLFSYPFRHPATDLPLALGSVTTTLAGTSTLVATFADAALTFQNPNPLPLNPSGYGLMFFSPLNGGTAGVSYDVVVKDAAGVVQWTFEDVVVPVPTAGGNATSIVIGHGPATTLTIAGGSITPTKNIHLVTPEGGAADNLDTIAITQFPDGGRLTLSNTNGSAPITIRNNQGNIFTSDGQNVVLSTTAQRLSLIRYGANFYVDMQVGGSGSGGGTTTINAVGNFVATGRLTLVSADPLPIIDVGSNTNIYYTPYVGNVIDLYDGVSAWQRMTFSELSISLAGLQANGVFDVFAYLNGGVVAITYAQWASAIARTISLNRLNGVLVLSGQPHMRYLGTFGTINAGEVSDIVTARMVWNYYNRVRRPMRRLETTATWVYDVPAYRQANGSALNQLTFIVGVSEDSLNVHVEGHVKPVDPLGVIGVSIGLDSAISAAVGVTGGGAGIQAPDTSKTVIASLETQVPEGRHAFVWLEYGSPAGTTWTGVGPLFHGGISGSIFS